MRIGLFITGRMYHLAAQAPDSLELPDGATLRDALTALREQMSEPLPDATIVTIAGRHVGALGEEPDAEIRDGDELMLVAPVAGG